MNILSPSWYLRWVAPLHQVHRADKLSVYGHVIVLFVPCAWYSTRIHTRGAAYTLLYSMYIYILYVNDFVSAFIYLSGDDEETGARFSRLSRSSFCVSTVGRSSVTRVVLTHKMHIHHIYIPGIYIYIKHNTRATAQSVSAVGLDVENNPINNCWLWHDHRTFCRSTGGLPPCSARGAMMWRGVLLPAKRGCLSTRY